MDAKSWALVLSGLFGGLGLFLYGMKLMSDGLQKTAGDRIRIIIEKLTSNRFIGLMVGAIATVLVQSSSATTVMMVGFVNAGLMSLTQALSIVLGANIGTTITAQILAFKISAFALPLLGVGAFIALFVKNNTVLYIGEILMGFGMLFFGMTVMTGACEPLNNSAMFRDLFVAFSHQPLLAVLAGTITTLVVQSSAATIGITLALATNGLVDFPAAAALVLGDNIGTTITANLAAIGGSRTAKQAAFGHFLFNAIGVCYMLILMKPFLALITAITPGDPSFMAADGTFPYVSRHIANVHTMFNVLNAAIFLPFLPLLAFLCRKAIKTDIKQRYEFTHLADALVNTPETAVAQVNQEVERMSSITMTMLNLSKVAIQKNDKKKMGKISEFEKTLDGFKHEIHRFLNLVQSKPLSAKAIRSVENIKVAIDSLEEIGDQAQKIMKVSTKMLEKELMLSSQARKELDDMFDTVVNFADATFKAFSAGRKQTEAELEMEDEIDEMHKQFRKNHVKRLNKGICNIDMGISFVDILGALEKIGDHIFSVAQLNLHRKELA